MAVRKNSKGGTPKPNALMAARAAVTKALKDDDPTVDIDPATMGESRPHISTGSVALDYLIGGRLNRVGVAPCPGWPRGGISQIYGHESSGKTTVALTAAAAVCAKGGMVCFIDWENAVDIDYARTLGVPVDDPSKFYLSQPQTLEQGMKVMWAMCSSGIDLVILDSISAGVPEEIFNQKLEDQGHIGRVGLVAAKWANFLPKVAALINRTGTHVMGISQLRKKINTMGHGGDGTQASGGQAWLFYSYVRMKFQKVKSETGKVYNALTHKQEDQVVSSIIKAKIDKSKVSSSQQHVGEFYVVFGEGIDNLRTCIEVCVNHKKIIKGGAWYTFDRKDGTQIKSQGLAGFKRDLAETKGAMQEIVDLAMTTLQSIKHGAPMSLTEDDEDGEDINLDKIMFGSDNVDLDALLTDEDGDDGE